MKETTTTYAYKLKYLENPTFDKVRNFAKKFIDELPKELVDELYSQLERGVIQIDSEPQMLVYLYSLGKMHQAKLFKAFENIPDVFFDQPEINIIDYGCGQAIGTMCYADYLSKKGIAQKIKKVTLIEPSDICLKRAALHTSAFLPDAETITVNKEFDYLSNDDSICDEEIPTLHILSNVLDLEFDLGNFAQVISDNLKGFNQFACVGPYFNLSNATMRLNDFSKLISGKNTYSKVLHSKDVQKKMSWTGMFSVFYKGELNDKLTSKVTEDDIIHGIKRSIFVEIYHNNDVIKDYGVLYSNDGKRLLKCEDIDDYNSYFDKLLGENYDNDYSSEGFDSWCKYEILERTRVICDNAFSGCGQLEEIIIPDFVTIIGDNAFDDCKNLQRIVLPDSVKEIGKNAFDKCNLDDIIIPHSVRSIGEGAFYGCEIQDIKSESPLFVVQNKMLIDIENHKLLTYFGNDEQIIIPESVNVIGESAFKDNRYIHSITIPNTVIQISENAFYDCINLEKISIPDSVTRIGNNAFFDCKSLREIIIPNSVNEIGTSVFGKCVNLKSIILGAENQHFSIRDHMLIDKDNAKILAYYGDDDYIYTLLDIKEIEDYAFYNCKSLHQIHIPNSVTRIGDYAFCGCDMLQEITISEAVTYIGNCAFEGCKSLKRITLPGSCTSIQEKITFPKTVKYIGDFAFFDCQSLERIKVPFSVTYLGNYAFSRCYSLKEIKFEDELITDCIHIGKNVFSYCSSLQEIDIYGDCFAINDINDSYFSGCKSLKSVLLPDTITNIGEQAFRDCSSLENIDIPENVTNIGRNAFEGCSKLLQIVIPKTVKNIRRNAFVGCWSLFQIIISDANTKIDKNIFERCVSLQQIIIPEGSIATFKKMLPQELWNKLFYLKKAE